jgi:hypothetical protein
MKRARTRRPVTPMRGRAAEPPITDIWFVDFVDWSDPAVKDPPIREVATYVSRDGNKTMEPVDRETLKAKRPA